MLDAAGPQSAGSGLDPAALFAPIADRDKVGLAVSGGPDSLALMLLYAAWSPITSKPSAIVYTLDHRLRPESAAEADMVAASARALGFAVRKLAWEAPKPDTGRQEAARAARYQLIGTAMREDDCPVLLTGHHRTDQAETLLMRMAHGSGVSGLAGMAEIALVEGVTIFRPLLATDPQELAALVAQKGVTPAFDPSNVNSDYERSRWRAALPGLTELGLSPERLSRLSQRLARVDALADRCAADFLDRHGVVDALGVVSLEDAPLVAADAEIAVRVLGASIAAASGRTPRALGQIEALAARLQADGDVATTLGGARIDRRGARIIVYREAGRLPRSTITIAAGQSGRWDDRFTISAGQHDVCVGPAHAMTREWFAGLAGQPLASPVAALRAAPLVTDVAGRILAVGAHVIGQGLSITAPVLTAWQRNCGKRPPRGEGALVSPE